MPEAFGPLRELLLHIGERLYHHKIKRSMVTTNAIQCTQFSVEALCPSPVVGSNIKGNRLHLRRCRLHRGNEGVNSGSTGGEYRCRARRDGERQAGGAYCGSTVASTDEQHRQWSVALARAVRDFYVAQQISKVLYTALPRVTLVYTVLLRREVHR